MTKGGSRYEHGAGNAQRGGYGLSDHRDEDINASQYQNRFGFPEPSQGGSDQRLPGIGALFNLLHQDNGSPTNGRVAENQYTHGRYGNLAALPDGTPQGGQAPRKEQTNIRHSDYICMKTESQALHSSNLSNSSGSRNVDLHTERNTQGTRPRLWHKDEDGELIGYVRDGYNWTEIAAQMHRTEDSVRGHWYYGNLQSDPRAQGVRYSPLHRSGASLRPGPRP